MYLTNIAGISVIRYSEVHTLIFLPNKVKNAVQAGFPGLHCV